MGVLDVMEQGVRDGVFPYGEWCVFTREGVGPVCATQGPGGRWFDCASLTKIFTATAVLEQIRRGTLRLEDRAVDILPLSGWLAERLQTVTVERLLTLTAGLPAWYPFDADQQAGRPFFAILETVLRDAAPETGMVYSDLGFMLLREIVCRVSGLAFAEAIEQLVCRPREIGEACFCPPRSLPLVPSCRDNGIEERMCRDRGITFSGFCPHRQDVVGIPNDGNARYFFHGISGHAGLFATARALAQLGVFYLRTEDPAFTQALQPRPGCEGRCLGFHTGTPFPTGCGHTGFTGTSLWIDREAGFGMAILTNRLYADTPPVANMNQFRAAVHEALLREQDRLNREEPSC